MIDKTIIQSVEHLLHTGLLTGSYRALPIHEFMTIMIHKFRRSDVLPQATMVVPHDPPRGSIRRPHRGGSSFAGERDHFRSPPPVTCKNHHARLTCHYAIPRLPSPRVNDSVQLRNSSPKLLVGFILASSALSRFDSCSAGPRCWNNCTVSGVVSHICGYARSRKRHFNVQSWVCI